MIYIKTELGQTALQNRSIPLTPRQRSAFIMFDGKRSVDDVLKATAGLQVTADDLVHLVSLGLLAPLVPSGLVKTDPPITDHMPDGSPTLSAQEHYSRAYPIAIKLTSALGLRGFRLNLAVEGAADLEQLQALAPKIKEAVGPEKFKELQDALYN